MKHMERSGWDMEQQRICAFGVREDEWQALEAAGKEWKVDIKICREEPTLESAPLGEGCTGVTISGQSYIGRELLETYGKMGIRYLTTRTRGFNHIDTKAARDLGIRVAFATYPPNSVAEFTIMLMLMCLRNYKQYLWRGQVNDFDLKGLQGRDLGSLTVAVLGTGQIGAQVVRYLKGFGCRILAYDPYPREELRADVEYMELEQIYQEADLITLHLPLFPNTSHMINQETIGRMKDGVVLINCARGELADTEALILGIESGKIGALGLDTVEGEEGIIHGDHRIDIISNRNLFYLRQFRNVVMTPHMAFFTANSVESMVRCGVGNICRMAAGEPCAEEI